MKKSEILKRAKTLIEDATRHLQNSYYSYKDGTPKFCAIGALRHVAFHEDLNYASLYHLLEKLSQAELGKNIYEVNDGPDGHAKIMAIYQKAIEQVEVEEKGNHVR